MSKYTTEVRFICESNAGLRESEGDNDVGNILEKSWNKIFNFDFPIFDESYRKVLCIKILKHYYTREIAHETVGRWKLALDQKMNEIMPYYNQLYKSELLEFNPFNDVNVTRSRKGSGTRDSNGSTSGTFSESGKNDVTGKRNNEGTESDLNKTLFSDTPQNTMDTASESSIALTTATKVIDDRSTTNDETNETHGTDSRNNETKGTSTENVTSTDEWIETVIGKQGSANYSDLLLKFRKTMLNIDMQIIKELGDCFFTLW